MLWVTLFLYTGKFKLSGGIIIFTEPTNNIAPKAIDKKIGFTLVMTDVKDTVFMMCPVVAFPVPLFRY
jgi:hypothetical protein